jgi:ribonuclease R
MNENDITRLLKDRMADYSTLKTGLEAVTAEQDTELKTILTHLQDTGIVGEHQGSYYLLKDQHVFLARVSMKTHNFVILKGIPNNEDAKISGKEALGLLVGDLVYAKEFQQGIYHCLSYYKASETLNGRYSLTQDGKASLNIDYLNSAGFVIAVTAIDKSVGKINQGDLVTASILEFKETIIRVKITKLLVRASDVGSDISMIISENNAPITFPDTVVAEAKALPQSLSDTDKEGRKDFTADCVVTIDGDDAHDFDDAVQAKRLGNGYEIVVHIADVTAYVKPNHPLDDEALRRGTSIYVADRVVPMLPLELSNGICSLNPKVERLVLSCTMDVDALGNVFHATVEKGVIASHGRLTYHQVNDLWDGKESDLSDEIKATLAILKDASDAVRKRRAHQGAMKLESTELKFQLDETGDPTDVTKVQQGPAEKMIEDMMILANVAVSRLLRDAKIPVLYRVHELPPKEKLAAFRDYLKKMNLLSTFPKSDDITGGKLNDFLDSIKDEGIRSSVSTMLLRAMSKARYSPDELGHFGLAELDYCHFTSPIRRYPDDIIHRLIKDYLLDGKAFDYDEEFARLESLGDLTSSEEVRADVIERTVDDLEAAKYMVHHIGELYHGKVISMVQRGMFVKTEIGIEGFLAYHCMHGDVYQYDERSFAVYGRDTDISFSIGTPIDVKVLAADPKDQEIDFATPEFYDEYAVDLSEEDRENLSLNGIRIVDEDSYRPMSGRLDFSQPDSRNDDYPDEKENAGESGDNEEKSMVKKVTKKAVDEKEVKVAPVAKVAAGEEKPVVKAKAVKKAKKAAVVEAPAEKKPAKAVDEKAVAENKQDALDQLADDQKDERPEAEEAAPRYREERHDDYYRPTPEEFKIVDLIRDLKAKFFDPKDAAKIKQILAIMDVDDATFKKLEPFAKPRDRFGAHRDGGGFHSGFGDRGGFRGGDRGGYRGGFGHSDRGGYGDRGGFGHSDRGGFGHSDRGSFGDRGGFGHSDRGGFGHSDRGGYGDRGGFGHSDRGGFGHSDRGGYGHSDRGGYGDRGGSRGGYSSHTGYNGGSTGGNNGGSTGGSED